MADNNRVPPSEELQQLSNQELRDRGLTGAKPEDNEDEAQTDAENPK